MNEILNSCSEEEFFELQKNKALEIKRVLELPYSELIVKLSTIKDGRIEKALSAERECLEISLVKIDYYIYTDTEDLEKKSIIGFNIANASCEEGDISVFVRLSDEGYKIDEDIVFKHDTMIFPGGPYNLKPRHTNKGKYFDFTTQKMDIGVISANMSFLRPEISPTLINALKADPQDAYIEETREHCVMLRDFAESAEQTVINTAYRGWLEAVLLSNQLASEHLG